MKVKRSKYWVIAFLTVPALFFVALFLPFYHAGGGAVTSLGAYFWFPENNVQTTTFLAMFYENFRANDLISALWETQLAALFIIIITLILKDRGIVALIFGVWGLYGLFTFLTTRSLAFEPVLVHGGFASILIMLIFLSAVVISAYFFYTMYREYRKIVILAKQA